MTINKHIKPSCYPMPRFEDIASKLNGCTVFSVIDLKDAYLQLPVAEEARKYLTIVTHKGYFRYKRLPFGVNFAPALFQECMDKVLSGLERSIAYLDDIICGSISADVHMDDVRQTMMRLKIAGLRSEPSKCKLFQTSVPFLGHIIDSHGVHPAEDKLEVMRDLRAPTSVKELRSFIGVVGYYQKFIPNLQMKCAPLHGLLKKGVKWLWTPECEKSFQELKMQLTASDTLVFYDPELPIILTTDASDVGISAVITHRYSDNTERPIAYASRVLSDAERRYSVIEREALALIYGVQKFQHYLLGRRFTMRTDHKPLETIFGADRNLPKVAHNRLDRWAVILSGYDYDIQYVTGQANHTADLLSRLPSNDKPSTLEKAANRMHLLHLRIKDLPITPKELKNQTISDKILGSIIAYMARGWPDKKALSPEFYPYFEKRTELSYEQDTLLWRGRIIVPTVLRTAVLDILHDGHPGVTSMLDLARFTAYWPGMDDDVEKYVRSCQSCQEARAREPLVPLHAWNVPQEKWSRIHIDFAGPFKGQFWFVVVDAYSKWIEIESMRTITSANTIAALGRLIARFGVPRSIVSDNGTQFTSQEFSQFCKNHNIVHIKSTPYHPRTNGLAERAVRTFKDRIKAAGADCMVERELQQFLFSYRNTRVRATGQSPAEIMFGTRLRTRLDLLKPDVRGNLSDAAVRYKLQHDRHARDREFAVSELVWCWSESAGKFVPGVVTKRTSHTSYNVRVDGIVRRRHADQLRRRYLDSQPEEITEFPVDDLTNRPQQPPIFPEIGREPEHPAASSVEGKPLTIPATDVVQNELPAADGTVTEKSAVPPVSVVAHDLHRSQRGLVPVKPRLYQYYADNSNMK